MAPQLQPYPAYEPSGLEWLPEIPAHWRTERGKWLLKKMKRPIRDADEVITCFRDGVVTCRKNRRTEGFTEALQEIGYQGIRVGDLVVHAMDAFAGAIGVSDSDGKGTPVYSVCRPAPNANAYFFAHILREMARSQWIAALATGIRERSTDFRYATLASQKLPLPPLPEQHAIARYLDHVDRRIQRYIDTKEKLIALLQEARQATIQRAVTRGLDPDVPLKPSGVDWLGDVPGHWDVRRLRTLGEAIIGLTYSPQDVVDEDEGTLVLRASNISEGRIVYGDNVYVRCSIPDRLVAQEGDILICSRSGSRALIGKNARIDSETSGTTFGAFMTIFRSPHNDYLHCIFNSKLFEYQSGAFLTSTINQLTLGILNNFKIPWPPSAEQEAIAAYLDKVTATIDASIDSARRQVELMREYRTNLIAHVVTGKLDVRAAAERIGMKTSYQ